MAAQGGGVQEEAKRATKKKIDFFLINKL